MDVGKYIGLFLLKHNFCYIPGLGNLELKRKPASYNGDALQSPSYEVLLTPGGSIDDSLANFIATNEKISIASASNAMRNFADQAKLDLQEEKEVIIPSLGKFIMLNGKTQFVTDPHLKYAPASIATLKQPAKEPVKQEPATNMAAPQFSKYDTTSTKPPVSTNWGNIIIVSVIALIILGGIAYGAYYISQRPADTEVVTAPEQPKQEVVAAPVDTTTTPATDTMTTAAGPAVVTNPNTGLMNVKVILNTYATRIKAEKRRQQMTTFGNTVEMIEKDSTTYYVVMPISVSAADTTHVLDSLRRTFNPKGVSIYR